VDIVGLDVSPLAVGYARRRAQAKGVPVVFEVHDVVRQPLPKGFDVVMSSLFLHHLEETDAVQLLRSMAAVASRLVLVNDLRPFAAGLCHGAGGVSSADPFANGPRRRTAFGSRRLFQRTKFQNFAIPRAWRPCGSQGVGPAGFS